MMLARPFRRRRVKGFQVYMKANTPAVTRPRQDNLTGIRVDAEALIDEVIPPFGIESSPIG